MSKKEKTNFIILFILTNILVWIIWTQIGKDYIEKHIKEEYGYSINQTYNNSELIKNLLKSEDDT
jgi:hypothetical protein